MLKSRINIASLMQKIHKVSNNGPGTLLQVCMQINFCCWNVWGAEESSRIFDIKRMQTETLMQY